MAGISEYKGIQSVPYPKDLPPPGTPLTESELMTLHGDGWRLELVDGRLDVMSPAGWPHGIVCGNVFHALSTWSRSTGKGTTLATDTGTRLTAGNVRAPDTMWISDETHESARKAGPGFLPLAPELAVEVLSPSDTYKQTARRIRDLLSAGCRDLWLIDYEDRWLEIHRPGSSVARLSEDDELNGGNLLPGFHAKIADFFKGV